MYKIKLPDFEGPFDLLLYFIKRDEINIYDIPISKITEEFLNYIRLMKYFDLELAGEFILMASNLMYIKSQMLLPRNIDDEGVELDDPRKELVQKILEYKQFKDVSAELAQKAESARYHYYRELFDAEYSQVEGESIYKNATLFDLMRAFQNVLARAKQPDARYVVEVFNVTVEEKVAYLQKLLKTKPRLSFYETVRNQSRPHIIVTFLAILEMLKLQLIFVYQETHFDDISISLRSSNN
ncbi:MAG: segregation/condensation protein A [Ignavibacteria bacterium]|nr:segregation/condensation protein A [Ignavibacteria bacterium]